MSTQQCPSYQVNDWINPLPGDELLARGMMGDGHIDLPTLTTLVTAAGYTAEYRSRDLNQEIWNDDPADIAHRVVRAFAAGSVSDLTCDADMVDGPEMAVGSERPRLTVICRCTCLTRATPANTCRVVALRRR